MKKIYCLKYLLPVYLMLLSVAAFAQTGSISGKVVDEKNLPLPGASVSVMGTERSTSTDADGNFRLTGIPEGSQTVLFKFIGYQDLSRVISVKGDMKLDVQLLPGNQSLNEVVVIGYGTQQKKDLTGSIATVSSKDFQKGNITTPEQLISGKVAGVQITSNGGAPGSGSTIRIRSGASLNASNDPLIVVDGVPLSNSAIPGAPSPLSLINSNDIETFTVLKDASATAIYGSRASNGVILITTKKGSNGKPSLSFSTQFAMSQLGRQIDVLSAAEFRDYVNANGTAEMKARLGNANTNWQDEVFQTANSTDNNLSISGSLKNMPYRVSLGYMGQNGILITDNLKRTSGAITVSPKLFDNHLKIDLNLKGSLASSRFANQGAIGSAIQFDPTQPVRTTSPFDNYFEWANTNGTPNNNAPRNPVALIKQKDDISDVSRSFGNMQLDYSFHFLPELHANLNLGYDVSRGKGTTFVPANAAQSFSTQGSSTRYKTDFVNKVAEFYLNYSKDIASIKSNINLTAGTGYYDYQSKAYNYPTLNAAGAEIIPPKFPYDKPHNRLISYYGRAIYTLNNKYILSGTLRTDGSSRFNPGGRWGVFPSAAFTWRVGEESFLKNSKSLSDLKLRLSYGVTGQQDGIENYGYLARYSSSANEAQYQIGDTFYNMFGPAAYDVNLKWEQTTTYNGGIDFGFLNNRINGSIDVYYKKTKDLLSLIPVPVGTNFSNELLTNIGNMNNRGLEINLNGAVINQNNITWDLGLNFTVNESEVTNLTAVPVSDFVLLRGGISGGTGNSVQSHTIGYAPYTFYVYKQVYDENGKPLEGVYVDQNGDGIINQKDLYRYKSPAPKAIFGFTTHLAYKKWSLNTVLRANFGNYVYNNVASNLGTKQNVFSTNGFLGNGTKEIFNSNFSNPQYRSDYYIQNASFLRMDNLTIGYNVGRLFKNNNLGLRVNTTCQNVFTVTKYDGLDPELSNGIDYTLYPRPRTFVLGLNLDF